MKFTEKLTRAVERTDSLLCVGLDPDYRRLPMGVTSQFALNKAIIDATADVACVFKPNPAFYEALGADGVRALKETCDYVRRTCPETPIILDAKRGDIGNTNAGYVEYAFDYLGADAVTVPPYMGGESLAGFLEREDKGVIVLCRTSNAGAGEFQDLEVDGEKLYLRVARQVARAWNRGGNCMLVAGAAYPTELAQIRAVVGGEMPLLVPGIGAQGGNVAEVVRAGLGAGGRGIMVNASRSVMFATREADFATAARRAAVTLRDEINLHRRVGPGSL
jgi:orotidine-5'-phosphate decarboxylase